MVRKSSVSAGYPGFSIAWSKSTLYTTTAVIELGAGLALLCAPSATVRLLIGARLTEPAPLAVARVAGAALLGLGAANWLARADPQSPAALGLIAAMILYNLGVALILSAAGTWSQLEGAALWPAVLLHAAMAVWCIVSLLNGKRDRSQTPFDKSA